ncbi:hypothetical protein [Aliikangiella maris]|uniref:Uncharacterized protein n=2 Tax=Aliikangiella maris TaxID=3162458 RepID=A0ABV2BYI8_9GAMM
MNLNFDKIENSELLNNSNKETINQICHIFKSKNVSKITINKSIFGQQRLSIQIVFTKPILIDNSLSLEFEVLSELSSLKLNRIRFNENNIELNI